MRSAAPHASIAGIRHRRDMEERIRFIGEALGTESTAANLLQTREILDQVADLVRDGGSGKGGTNPAVSA